MATPFPGMMNYQMGLNSQPVHVPYSAGLPQGGQPGYQQMPAPDWRQWLNSNVPGGSSVQQPGFMAQPNQGGYGGRMGGMQQPQFGQGMFGAGQSAGSASSPYQSANLQGLLSLLQHPALQQAMGAMGSGVGSLGTNQLPGSMGGSANMAEGAPVAGQLGYGRTMNQQPQASLASLLGRGRAGRNAL